MFAVVLRIVLPFKYFAVEMYLYIGLGFSILAFLAVVVIGIYPALVKRKKSKGKKKED